MEIDYHFIYECVIRGDLKVQYIPTEDQLADLLTKALPFPWFLLLSNKLLHSSRLHVRGMKVYRLLLAKYVK